MEKHSLCDSCILEIVTALDTSPIFEAVNAFGPTVVMIIGLLIIECRRAANQQEHELRMAQQALKDNIALNRQSISGTKTAMEDIERQRENQ